MSSSSQYCRIVSSLTKWQKNSSDNSLMTASFPPGQRFCNRCTACSARLQRTRSAPHNGCGAGSSKKSKCEGTDGFRTGLQADTWTHQAKRQFQTRDAPNKLVVESSFKLEVLISATLRLGQKREEWQFSPTHAWNRRQSIPPSSGPAFLSTACGFCGRTATTMQWNFSNYLSKPNFAPRVFGHV
jgi:hypothetical protein